jgi:hypothetical protein
MRQCSVAATNRRENSAFAENGQLRSLPWGDRRQNQGTNEGVTKCGTTASAPYNLAMQLRIADLLMKPSSK